MTWLGGLPIVRSNSHWSGDPTAAREALVLSGMLGRQDLALLVTHRGKVFETIQDLDTAESAERNAIARLTEREPGLQDRIEEIGFVDNPHLAARWLEMN